MFSFITLNCKNNKKNENNMEQTHSYAWKQLCIEYYLYQPKKLTLQFKATYS
jgi:hypothetical protein